ncbi:ribonuclease Z [Oceanobacillus kimchii]|uniref:ribonuclease Z n=1 Tax=Oceanobacillus kimchii TaxID=746691 RepID=UPI003C778244
MELVFLGTGAGLPSKTRNVSAVALNMTQEINEVWLFDCGEATQHQILHTNLKPRKITKIFITHLHGDHIYGLPGLLNSRAFQSGENQPLSIYGPVGIKEFVESTLRISQTNLTYPITIKEITEDGQLFETKEMVVETKKLQHGIASYGYRINEKDKPGELLVEKLKEFGISPGPIYQQIKENEITKLDNGSIIYRDDVLGPPKKGKIISILGDTRYSLENIPFIKFSDILIHESTFTQEKELLAFEYKHSTNVQAAKLAKKANVNRLYLTHISSRYQEEDADSIIEAAREIFPSTWLANDFSVYEI